MQKQNSSAPDPKSTAKSDKQPENTEQKARAEVDQILRTGMSEDWKQLLERYELDFIKSVAQNSPNLTGLDIRFFSKLLQIPVEAFRGQIATAGSKQNQIAGIKPVHEELIRWILNRPEFKDYVLGGSASLALHYGHRFAADIDLFTWGRFSKVDIMKVMGGRGHLKAAGKDALSLKVEDIKVDFIKYPYKRVYDLVNIQGFRALHPLEITSHKLRAIRRRARKTDMIDFYIVAREYGLEKIVSESVWEAEGENPLTMIKSLLDFQKFEIEHTPVMLKPISWEEVKMGVTELVRTYFLGTESEKQKAGKPKSEQTQQSKSAQAD